MIAFLLRRAGALLLVLLLVSTLIFALTRLSGADPVTILVGDQADAATIAAIRHDWGLDQPLATQYLVWVEHMARGDVGTSLGTHEPVAEAVRRALPVTVELTLLSLLVALAVALPTGIASAMRPGSRLDAAVTLLSLGGVSLPIFVTAILLIYLFSLQLGLLPASGYTDPLRHPWQGLGTLILPAVAQGMAMAPVATRMLRSSMLEVLGQEYIQAARAKGLAESAVVVRHALRNALLPVVTVVGLQVGELLGGAVVLEIVFSLPGIGRLLVTAIFARDYPMVQGTVLTIALLFSLVNLGVDLLYSLLDPRIRYE